MDQAGPGAGDGLHQRGAGICRLVEGGQKTLVVTEIHADPKGSLPTWVVNMFQKDWPVKTIRNLRAQVAKGDIKESPDLASQVAGF